MQFIPIKTRVLIPPQDDLYAVLGEYLTEVVEGDIVLVSSKVIAISEGRCVSKTDANKADLVAANADVTIDRPYWNSPLTIVHNTFLGAAGIDESNGNGYYVLLPSDVFKSAEDIHSYLCTKHQVKNIGVIVTDSRSHPFRYGATGVALAWWGIEPLQDHIGRPDLFGRKIEVERSNLVDGLAAGATVIAGEVNECIPVVIARGVPNITFVDGTTKDSLFSPFEDDTFRVLYDRFLPKQ
jgi:F420-0:gamma-glutamyl ligase